MFVCVCRTEYQTIYDGLYNNDTLLDKFGVKRNDLRDCIAFASRVVCHSNIKRCFDGVERDVSMCARVWCVWMCGVMVLVPFDTAGVQGPRVRAVPSKMHGEGRGFGGEGVREHLRLRG